MVGALAAFLQHVIHHAREQLHRHILEGEGRAMEEFEHEEIVADLHQRTGRGVAKPRIRFLDHGGEGVIGDLAIDEPAKYVARNLRIGLPGIAGNGLRIDLRIASRHIEPAIAREPGQERIVETDRGRFAPGGDMQARPVILVIWLRRAPGATRAGPYSLARAGDKA